MTKTINEHQGSKYLRLIYPADQSKVLIDSRQNAIGIYVDVYAVIEAFGVTCPARQHALKKLLCCGNRDKGNELDDLIGVEAAVARAIELQRQRDRVPEDSPKQEEIKDKSHAELWELWKAVRRDFNIGNVAVTEGCQPSTQESSK